MTQPPAHPPLGDYSGVPALNLAGLTAADIEAALPLPSPQQQEAWNAALANINQAVLDNQATRAQVSVILANVAAIARSVGMILTIA